MVSGEASERSNNLSPQKQSGLIQKESTMKRFWLAALLTGLFIGGSYTRSIAYTEEVKPCGAILVDEMWRAEFGEK